MIVTKWRLRAMTYRDILVQIDTEHGAELRAATAVAIAQRTGAKLTGAFLKSEFLVTYGSGEGLGFMTPADFELLLKQHTDSIANASAAARDILAQAARDAGVTFGWIEIDGDSDGPLGACARFFDLTVLPPLATTSHGLHRISAASVAMASGGPVLILPEQGFAPGIGKRVLVAWKDTRESARALRDAWPILEVAEEVSVVSVASDGPDSLFQRHLELHGCKAKVVVDRRTDAPTGDLLRLEVGKVGADLLVMGLYGRPRLQELILGGVSRELLRDPPVPLLVSH
jgi:nucleotide-binding universal stress UspA family protein